MKNVITNIGIIVAIIFGLSLLRSVIGSLFGDTASDWIVGILSWGSILVLIVLAVRPRKKKNSQ